MFGTPDQYTKLLNLVGFITFIGMVLCSLALVSLDPTVPHGPSCEVTLQIVKLQVSAFWTGGALLAAMLFRMGQLHNRISDVVGLRKRYDVQYVIVPMFKAVAATGTVIPENEVFAANRRALMKKIFYAYAKGTPGDNLISEHLVSMAWESLFWLWVSTELAFVCLVFSLISVFLSTKAVVAVFFSGFLFFFFFALVAHQMCKTRTAQEVEAILDDEKRQENIRKVFDDVLR